MLTKTIAFEFPLHRYRELPPSGLGGARTKFIVAAILQKLDEADNQKGAQVDD